MQYSIVTYQSLVDSSHSMRMDADFFHPVHLENLRKIERQSQPLSRFIIHMTGGATPLGAVYPPQGIPFLRVQNIMPNYISETETKYLSPSQNQEIKRSQLIKNDVLLTITGSYGKSAIVTDEWVGANINQHSVKITVKDIVPYFLSTFLNCKYGYSQSTLHIVGVTRPALDYAAIKKFRVPDLSCDFQKFIESYCHLAEKLRKNSKECYIQAEGILLAEMGLVDWRPKHCLSFVKNYSDTKRAGRMDADYFQPKYEEIIHAIQSYPGGCDTLGNMVAIQKCVEVGSGEYLEDGVPFVRVSNLSPFEITEEKYISSALYNTIQKHQPQSGEILLTKDATPGIAYHMREQAPKMIPSSGILRLKRKTDKINDDYLMLTLNSILTRQQVARDVGGSVILHWRPEQVIGTVIPILAEDKQIEIRQRVAEAFALRRRSKHLLECAKRAVELAIEQDEQTAIDWLKLQTK